MSPAIAVDACTWGYWRAFLRKRAPINFEAWGFYVPVVSGALAKQLAVQTRSCSRRRPQTACVAATKCASMAKLDPTERSQQRHTMATCKQAIPWSQRSDHSTPTGTKKRLFHAKPMGAKKRPFHGHWCPASPPRPPGRHPNNKSAFLFFQRVFGKEGECPLVTYEGTRPSRC